MSVGEEKKADFSAENVGRKRGRLINYRPALSCVIALIFGILFAFCAVFRSGIIAAFVAFIFIAVSILIIFFSADNRKFKGAKCVALLLFFSIGAAEFLLYRQNYQSDYFSGEKKVVARIESRRDYEKGASFILGNVSFDGKEAKGKLTLFLYLSGESENAEKASSIKEGDIVKFTAEITTNTAWSETDEDGTEKSRVYYWRENIRYTAKNCEEICITAHTSDVFEKTRAKMKSVLFSAMGKDAAAVGYALLTGETAQMDETLLQNIRYGGIAHIFAVSGLHIGALFAFFIALFKKGKLKSIPPLCRFVLSAVLLLLYGGVCGYSASVIRATAMCLVFYADTLLGIKRDGVESLAKAAIIVLLLSPVSLFDAGFLLSFAAAAGLILFLPILIRERDKLLAKWQGAKKSEMGEAGAGDKAGATGEKRKGAFWKIFEKGTTLFCTTFAATITTFPILTLSFSYASLAAILLNLIIVPIVSACFSAFLALTFFACIFPVIAKILLYIPSLLLSFLTTIFYTVDFSKTTISPKFSYLFLIFYYLALFLFSDKMRIKGKKRVEIALCFMAAGAVLLCIS